jgi:hypothetical protein
MKFFSIKKIRTEGLIFCLCYNNVSYHNKGSYNEILQ